MTSEVSIAVISALDLDFLPGDYLDKLREETQTSTARPSRTENEDSYSNSDTVKINKKQTRKKIPRKKTKIRFHGKCKNRKAKNQPPPLLRVFCENQISEESNNHH